MKYDDDKTIAVIPTFLLCFFYYGETDNLTDEEIKKAKEFSSKYEIIGPAEPDDLTEDHKYDTAFNDVMNCGFTTVVDYIINKRG